MKDFKAKFDAAVRGAKSKQAPPDLMNALGVLREDILGEFGSIENFLGKMGGGFMPELPAWSDSMMRSRLAERIRKTQRWCSALLRAPNVDNWEDNLAKENTALNSLRVYPIWEPGFVVELQDVLFWPKSPDDGRGKAVAAFYFGAKEICEMEVVIGSPSMDPTVYSWSWKMALAKSDDGYQIVQGIPTIPRASEPLLEIFRRRSKELAIPYEEFFAVYADQEYKHLQVVIEQLHQTFRLLQCKNVGLKEQTDSTGTKKKRYQRAKDKRQVDSYWVLDIPGSPNYWRRPEGAGPPGIEHRLHVVRGHFKTYTKDRPHVSGWTGPLWISSHARGNSELGSVDKDYNLQSKG